ncbi:MAG: InlB B-repeat-containing protein, partial [Bacteroidota bacterium]
MHILFICVSALLTFASSPAANAAISVPSSFTWTRNAGTNLITFSWTSPGAGYFATAYVDASGSGKFSSARIAASEGSVQICFPYTGSVQYALTFDNNASSPAYSDNDDTQTNWKIYSENGVGAASTPCSTTASNLYEYNLKFNANFGSGTPPLDRSSPSSQTVTLPVVSTYLTAPSGCSGSGYWNSAQNGTGQDYLGGSTITLTSAWGTTASPVTLYAKWSCPITYGAGGGSGSAPASPTSANAGATFTTPNNTYTRSGYSFAGWSDGTNTYAASATYPSSGSVSQSVTLTATWTDTTAPSTSVAIAANYLTSGTSVSAVLTTNETLSSVTLYYSTSAELSSPQSCGTTSNPSNGATLTCTVASSDATYYIYSRGTDSAGNIEAAPSSADDSIIRDTTA